MPKTVAAIDPWTDILCVHTDRRVVNSRVFDHTRQRVYLGVLGLRCVSKLSGRPCVFRGIVETAETESGEYCCDASSLLCHLPEVLEYRGNGLDVAVVKPEDELVFVTGRRRTAEEPEATCVTDPSILTDYRVPIAIVDTGYL